MICTGLRYIYVVVEKGEHESTVPLSKLRESTRQREWPGFSNSNIHKRPSFRSPEMLHPLVLGHLSKVSKDVGVLRYLSGPK